MKPNTKTLAAAALAGLFAAGSAMAGTTTSEKEKDKCSGKDGCDGKKKENIASIVTSEKEKDKCSGKDGCDGKKKEDDKDSSTIL